MQHLKISFNGDICRMPCTSISQAQLLKLVRQTFVPAKPFRMTYKDDEEEVVLITDDFDLKEAVRLIEVSGQQILRVNVTCVDKFSVANQPGIFLPVPSSNRKLMALAGNTPPAKETLCQLRNLGVTLYPLQVGKWKFSWAAILFISGLIWGVVLFFGLMGSLRLDAVGGLILNCAIYRCLDIVLYGSPNCPIVLYCNDATNAITALDIAVRGNNCGAVQALLVGGADPNAKEGQCGWTPLHSAAYYKAGKNIFQALLVAGADVNAKSLFDITPLHNAAEHDKVDAVEALLAAGADINAKNNPGNTPLHYAASNKEGDVRVLRALLAAGAELHVKSSSGWTPLHLAAMNSKEGAVRALLAAGADVLAEDNAGRTALDCARDEAVRELLRAAAAAPPARAAVAAPAASPAAAPEASATPLGASTTHLL